MASGMSGLFSKCESHLGITLYWIQGPRASSQVEGENLEVFLELQQEVWRSSRLVSQGTSGVAKRESNFLLICEGTSVSLTMLKPLTVWIITKCYVKEKTVKNMGKPDCLTCLLRNLYGGQEATD